MAIPFLNHLDLRSVSELQNALLHKTTTTTASNVEAKIIYDTGTNSLQYYNGTTWINLDGSGDIAGVTAGDYLNGGGTSGTVTLNHDTTTRTDTTSTDAPSYGGTFEAVTSVTTNTYGHVTAIDVSTVTIPASDDTTYDLTGSVSNITDFAIALDGSDGTLDKVFLKASTYITLTDGGSNDVTLTHANTSRSDTTSTDSPAFGGTFTAVQSVTTNSTGHVTAIDVSTVTIPASDDTTYDLTGSIDGGNGKIVLTGSDSSQDIVTLEAGTNITLSSTGANSITIDAANPDQTVTLTGDVTGTGTTSIATTISAGAVDFAMLNSTDVITAAEGIENNDNDVTIPTSAAVKAYADSLIVGGLIYQGGYNAATNTPDLTTSPNSIEKGWTYTVTADGTFFGEQLRVGDVLIAEVDDPSALADWTTVQNNIDLASDSQVGIGNVKASTVDVLKGIDVTYNASGSAFVGLDIDGLTLDTLGEQPSDYFLPIYDQASAINNKAKLSELLAFANSVTSKAYTITDTATITYPFTLTAATQNDTIIQLVDTVTNETVYADVDRISTTQATITFASTPTNSIRVLVQKIG